MMFNREYKIGDTIAKLRKEKGWTQIEFAEKLQVSDKAVSKWESNRGDPSLEFLPAIAELFDVTLDYLMTGKEQEEKVIIMSKLELCAKNDDVELYKSLLLPLKYEDENKKTIFDYIFEYESKNLFKFILPNFASSASGRGVKFFENFYYMRLLCNDTSIIHDLIRLEYIDSTINNKLGRIENAIGYNGSEYCFVPRKIMSDRMIEIILYDKNLDKSIKKAMTFNHNENGFYSPALSYTYLIDYAIKKDDFKLAKELTKSAIEINKINREKDKNYGHDYMMYSSYFGYVRISNETFEKMLNKEQYEIIELANEVNSLCKERVLSSYEIDANKIKHCDKMSDKEKSLRLCIHNGILYIEELLATKDYDLIKENLYKYPINYVETFYEMIKNKNYRDIFRTAVDMGLDTDSIIKENLDDFCKELISEFWIDRKDIASTWNRESVSEYKKTQEPNFKFYKGWYRDSYRNDLPFEEVISKLKESRDVIIQNLEFENAKRKITKNLTKEFFESELAKNNIDRVVINLCVKLEAILKYDFRYDGDFQEMLSKYCETFNTRDDEYNDYDTKTPNLLNKLRMCRNSMVHAKSFDESLTKDELRYCIEHICNLEIKER